MLNAISTFSVYVVAVFFLKPEYLKKINVDPICRQQINTFWYTVKLY